MVLLHVWLSVCECVPVRSFLPPRSSRPRHIGTYVFTTTRKTLLYIIINFCWKCFVQKLRRHLLASNATNYFWATKYGYQRNPRNVCMTLLFAILTKNASFGSYSTFVHHLRAHILNINMRIYIHSALVHELSGCVRADAYNLILIFASYYSASWPCIYCVWFVKGT